MIRTGFAWAGAGLLLAACATTSPEGDGTQDTAEAEISTSNMSEIVRVLASDEFQGRAPGTEGETRTVAYLIDQFQAIGLEPGGRNGGWTDPVTLNRSQITDVETLNVTGTDGTIMEMQQGRDIVISSANARPVIEIEDAPIVFVGFGASAPERGWDDYGDVDLEGKVALFLVNDPDFGVPDDHPAAGLFGGKRMTYYGRWAYKFEEAARRGAVAAIVIHETEAAGYGWNVAASSPGENYAVASGKSAKQAVDLQGWLSEGMAEQWMSAAGYDLEELRTSARLPDFEAFTLEELTFNAGLGLDVETIESQNVLGKITGTERPDEVVMLSGHWDAYGVGIPDAQGRTVMPGANDDALGMAGIMEIARVINEGPAPERSIVVAAWTAEESGLLGSEAYAQDPSTRLKRPSPISRSTSCRPPGLPATSSRSAKARASWKR